VRRERARRGDACHRLAAERLIQRFRAAAVVFCVLQTAVEPGDRPLVSWLAAMLLAVSVAVSVGALRRTTSDGDVRVVGGTSMAVDGLVILSVLANNLSDPAEPVYMVTLLGVLEAAMRWSRRGAVIGGLVSGVAAAAWTWLVYDAGGTPFEASYASMRFGTLVIVGAFIGFIVERLNGERRRLQHTLDVSQDLIATLDPTGVILDVNLASVTLLGYEPREVVGRSFRAFMHTDRRPSERVPLLDQVLDGGGMVLIEHQFGSADGTDRWLELSLTAMPQEQVVYAVGRDVTERREVARRLAASEQRFRSLFEHSSDAVFALALDGTFTSSNAASETLTGYTQDELATMGFVPLVDPDHLPAVLDHFRLASDGIAQTYETVVRHRDGRRLDLHITNMPIVVDREVVGVYGVAKDVTERRHLERQLARQATEDALTGLPNRRAFQDEIGRLIESGDARGTVLFIDLDDFKTINDAMGHGTGDALLRDVADRLRQVLRQEDTPARLGGDEFAALLPGCDVAHAEAVAMRLLESLGRPFVVGGLPMAVRASIGIADTDGVSSHDELLRNADLAMYVSKRSGKGVATTFAAPMHDDARDRIELGAALPAAIAGDELVLHYQPIIDVATGEVAAGEALVRWQHPTRGLLAPGVFLPIADGLAGSAIDAWVTSRAMRQCADWQRRYPDRRRLGVTVNVSPSRLTDDRFPELLANLLQDVRIDPTLVIVEITEDEMLADTPATRRVLGRIRDLGIRLALDDFGAGFSSLAYLERMPVQFLKLDKKLIDGIADTTRSRALVGGIIDLSHRLGIRVVAEGVEEQAQLDALGDLGCDFAQGFLLQRPAAADVFETTLASPLRPPGPPATARARATATASS
jgi:diguanylate cyclase (GGDEF)-like protein/PAS domain S-box-containing protein